MDPETFASYTGWGLASTNTVLTNPNANTIRVLSPTLTLTRILAAYSSVHCLPARCKDASKSGL